MFLLDPNACIRILNNSSRSVVRRLERHRPSEIRLSSVVKAELLAGARKSRRVEANLALLAEFFAPFSSLPFDDLAAQHFGAIRNDLERAGTPIGAYDMMIAATARAYDLVLVTHNTRELSRVPGLQIADWEEG